MAQATTETAQAAPQEPPEPPQVPDEDALVKLYNQLLPLSKGLAAQARKDPKQFIIQLPRIISGTIVKGMVVLIEEVGARDQDHEQRLLAIEGHPLLNLAGAFDDDTDLPDPNDPAVLYALFADIAMCLDVLAGLSQKVPTLAENEVVQRLPQNRAMLEMMMKGVKAVVDQQREAAEAEAAAEAEGESAEPGEPPPELEPVEDMPEPPPESPEVTAVSPLDPALPADQQVKQPAPAEPPAQAASAALDDLEPPSVEAPQEGGADGQQTDDQTPSNEG